MEPGDIAPNKITLLTECEI